MNGSMQIRGQEDEIILHMKNGGGEVRGCLSGEEDLRKRFVYWLADGRFRRGRIKERRQYSGEERTRTFKELQRFAI